MHRNESGMSDRSSGDIFLYFFSPRLFHKICFGMIKNVI